LGHPKCFEEDPERKRVKEKESKETSQEEEFTPIM
jgi:hypothetical protein